MSNDLDHIRNFSIIAHVDHGKSTLADRLLEATGAVERRKMKEQVLDSMDLERERGITIKLNAIRLPYTAEDGDEYELNLIDTPGHVDFTYEVSRSLAACEGALLVIDAAQGIEAQTISTLYQAMDADLELIPVLNKIDLPSARPEDLRMEVCDLLGKEPEEVILASAKEGTNIDQILEAVVDRVPAPSGRTDAPLRALIFDSFYDTYKGAVPFIRVVDGAVRPGMEITFGANDSVYEVGDVGYLRLGMQSTGELSTGEVGYLTAQIKQIHDTKVGDTILDASDRADELLPGYKEVKPMVYAGLHPTESDHFEALRDGLEKLSLNDASLRYEPETSEALGYGFRCGFNGLLHMEIVQERLEREFDLDLITTIPNVEYRVTLTDGEKLEVENPAKFPERAEIETVEEPYVRVRMLTPDDHIGNIQKLCEDRRGEYQDMRYRDPERVEIVYKLPLAEIVLDFYDRLKSVSRGYGTMEYEPVGYEASDLVKLDILLNKDPVDALSTIVHRDRAYDRGRKITQKLKELIPRQMFEVPIQAAIGSEVVARETLPARRKNVTAKCYGGDVTRKRKLLERQKEGKKRMKKVGTVDVPQEAFMALLEVGD